MAKCRSKAELIIAVDDTDCPGDGGTGRVARAIADRLAERCAVWGVTRHQFIILPEINYTAKNSGNVVHVMAMPDDLDTLSTELRRWLDELAVEGSEPGLCVARTEALVGCELGRAAQQRFVRREEVRAAAEACGVMLEAVREDVGGIVGAFCGACLAAQGNDGRFVQHGRIREFRGELTVAEMLAAGVDEVRAGTGERLTEGKVVAQRLRPALADGRCVLYCSQLADGNYVPVKGRPEQGKVTEAL